VSGESSQQIFDALRASGPRDSKLISRDAYTYWHLSWKWGTTEEEIIDLNNVSILLTVKILIPELHTNQKSLALQWQAYESPLIRHEMRHHSFAVEGAQILKQRLSQEYAAKSVLPVARAREIAEEVLWQIRAKDEEYDLQTDHGKSEGVRWQVGRVDSYYLGR
jgi:predicted secreted Zn-dependent protease